MSPEEKLREAIHSGRYQEARELLAEYRGRLDRALQRCPEERQQAAAARKAQELIASLRQAALAGRADVCEQLRRLAPARRQTAYRETRKCWEING